MNKITKGALASAAGAALLLGGAGTLSYWTEDASVPGGAITSGSLSITGSTCGTAPWTLDGGATLVGKIVPGDTLTKTCTFTIEGDGDHFDDVLLDLDTATWSATNDLTAALGTPTATFADSEGTINDGDTVATGEIVTATIAMTFNSATTGDVAEDLTATLNALTVTATQNHTP